jgi:solute carrier family 35 protein E2
MMRGVTVILGLISLSHVAVSFTETVKSSAPLFTVLFAYLILGQTTPWQVMIALIPVMLGLAVSSATEISFDRIGFFAAIGNNIVDCVQNVFSKKLLNALTPVQLQFYTSCAAAVIQLPMILYTVGPQLLGKGESIDRAMMQMLFIDGLSFHAQSVTAYYTMSLLSPVSQSVANTLKRALLIVLSIIYFQNEVGVYNILGVTIVIIGVFSYNYTRRIFQ